MIRLSVVIPVYNAGDLLLAAVRSVDAGGRDDVEIIIVDDGSTDGCAVRAAGLAGVRVITQPNRGPGPARNAGIEAARAELVGFLDADDRWRPGKVEAVLGSGLPSPGADLVYTDYLRCVEGSDERAEVEIPLLPAPQAAALLLRNQISTATVVARRSALIAAGGFREDIHFAEDWDLWLRLLERGRAEHLAGMWTEKHDRAGTLANAHTAYLHRCERAVVRAAIGRRPDLYRPVARRALANVELRAGIAFLDAGDRRAARARLWRALLGGIHRPTLRYLARTVIAPIAPTGRTPGLSIRR